MNWEAGERNDEVRHTIMQLSEIADLVGLRQHIIEGTNRGRKLRPDPWERARDYMRCYADPTNTDALIGILQAQGCKNEIEAVRWLLKHDELVP